ncbi:cytochrome P450 family protein [Rhizoctonia solani 123E]|uniref:Cytochrome P450 family protein n=1 Tax=Rhizoctonia solani 123E TaxID=1423351 RepID=A0A074SEE4_9AGAM|nr:cytochrome P450 family protein [Rhizoctonia solani 123E]
MTPPAPFDQTFAMFVLALTLGIGAFILYFVFWPKPLLNFPHNPITSVLGDLPEILRVVRSGKTLSEYYALLVERHGPVIQMFIGWHMSLVVADRGEAERLMIKFKNVDFPPTVFRMFEPLIPLSIMGLPGQDTWKHHRRVLGPSMNRRFLTRMEPHVLNIANELVKLWERKYQIVGNRAFIADVDLGLASMNSLAVIGVGASLDPLDRISTSASVEHADKSGTVEIPVDSSTPMFDGIRNLMTKVGAVFLLPFPSITFPCYLWLSSSWRRDLDMLRSFLMDKITEAKKREVSHGTLATDAECVLDMLLQPDPRDGTQQFDAKELLDELAAFLIAGSTVGKVLAWFVKYMPQDPEIQQRLHNEMRITFEGNKEDASQCLADLNNPDKVPILEAVMAETLRCAQVTSATVRSLLNDDVIAGHHVSKGTNIVLPLWYFATQESEWGADAHTWRPSRWLTLDGSFDPNPGPTYYPFGLGHRSCFGQKLGVMQLKIFIATLSYAFSFKPVPPEVDLWHSGSFITSHPKKCYVSIKRWDSATVKA